MDYVDKRLDFLLKISNLHQNYSQIKLFKALIKLLKHLINLNHESLRVMSLARTSIHVMQTNGKHK